MAAQPVALENAQHAHAVRRPPLLFAVLLLLLGIVLVAMSSGLLALGRSPYSPDAVATRIAGITLGALAVPSFFQSAVLFLIHSRRSGNISARSALITAVAAPAIGLVGAGLAAFAAHSGLGVFLGVFPLVFALVIMGFALLALRKGKSPGARPAGVQT